MSNATTVIQPSQLKLAHALLVLRQWQATQDAEHRNRHGRCLESVRFALSQVGLHLPASQPKPHNIALWCGHRLAETPDKYGWERVKPPFAAKLTLEFYGACGHLPDGRYAGHVGLVDHEARVIYSSTDYPLDRFFLVRRFASFVPSP